MFRPTNRQAELEVWFRIVHISGDGIPLAAYHVQTVEIARGPKGTFEKGNIGSLRLRAPPSQLVISALPSKLTKEPKKPRIVELFRKAIEWRRQIDVGEVRSQAEIARREGITRARITQLMGILRLAPEIQQRILSTSELDGHPRVTERMLRPIKCVTDHRDQLREFHKLLE